VRSLGWKLLFGEAQQACASPLPKSIRFIVEKASEPRIVQLLYGP
jgi:hypothetical protein